MDRSVFRSTIQPVVGEENWQQIRAAGQAVRKRRARRAKVRAVAAATRAQLRDDDLLAAATQISAQRSADALRRNSDNLTWLAKHFRTDKGGAHSYTQHYQHHFQHLRTKQITLLEIGIGGYARAGDGGASLRMWKHYFPQGQIVGLDIQDKSFVDEARIRSFRGSQADPEVLAKLIAEIGKPDIIIDDGSHRPEHILASFEVLFPLLADNGIYVVEDTQTSYWPEFGGHADPADPNTSMALLKRLADGLNFMEFVDESYEPTYTDRNIVALHFYHNLVFIQKGPNTETTRKKAILRTRYAAPAS